MSDGPIFAEHKDEIAKQLIKVGAFHPCPRCTNDSFVLLDGYIAIALQSQFRGTFVLGQPVVPLVGVVCTRCGFVAQHALGMLNLLPPEPEAAGAKGAIGAIGNASSGELATGATGPIISSGSHGGSHK
jgi:ribosomal protein S27AE